VDVAFTDTYSVAVRDSDSDVVSFAAVDPSEWGAYVAGEVLLLSEALPSVPVQGWIWALGPYAEASLQFQVTDTTLTADFRRRISGLQYVPAVYPDGDGFADLPLSVGGPGDTLTSTAGGGLTLASLAGTVTVTEEAARDPNTGALSLSLVVSWRHDPETVQGIERTAIWLAQDGDSDPDQVGEVRGSGSSFRIEGIARRLPVGTVFRVWVQPVTRGGVRRSLKRCRSVAVSILGLFPVPTEPPSAGSVTLAGDQATYRVALPTGFPDRIVELWRGQPFIGQSVGRIPVGGLELPPTYNWCQLPTAADGRANVPLVARLVGVNGARGDFVRVDSELSPTGFGAPLLEASFEDGPFDTAPAGFTEAPVLTNLQLVTGRPYFSAQRLSWSGSALTASYDSTVFALGSVKRVHISAGFSGRQVAAETMAELRYPISSQYMRSWTPEGFTDPSHPLYDAIGCELQWAHSEDSDDPGTDYEPFVPGLAYVRSCRFRLALTRPTAEWDVLIDRFAVSVRPMRGVNRELLMQDGVTSPPVPIETEAGDDWLYQDD